MGLEPEPYRSPGGKVTRRWRCRCDCGNQVSVLQNALTASKNGTTSCGCVRKEKTREKARDLTGKRFGRLTVLGPVALERPAANGNRLGWRCRCDCGKEIISTQKKLELDGIKSCGCLLRDTGREKIVEKNVLEHFSGTAICAIRPGRKQNKNNKSGVRGVYWNAREQRWIAKIQVRGKEICLGRYASLEDAKQARIAGEQKYFAPILEAYQKEKDSEK